MLGPIRRQRDGNSKISHAVSLGGRQAAGSHIGLDRREQQQGLSQSGVASFSLGDELILADSIVNVGISGPLFTDRGLQANRSRPGAL